MLCTHPQVKATVRDFALADAHMVILKTSWHSTYACRNASRGAGALHAHDSTGMHDDLAGMQHAMHQTRRSKAASADRACARLPCQKERQNITACSWRKCISVLLPPLDR